MIYLDNSATTKQYEEVNKAMLLAMEECFGNPSSLHRLGMQAEKKVKEARGTIAKAMGILPEELYFTSGGTESDNTAVRGAAEAGKRAGKRIITTSVEHPAVLEPCRRLEAQGYEVVYLGVDKDGIVSAEAVKAALTKDTVLVSIMAVNNETGAIMPIGDISKIIRSYNEANKTNVLFHSDLVQSFGKVDIDLKLLDMASISAHKIHGPKGIGALYVRKGVNIEPFMLGGGQEKHMRSGTENVPAIIGFAEAVRLCSENFAERIEAMNKAKSTLLKAIVENVGDIRINSPAENCAPSVLNVSFMGTRGEVLLHSLEQKGVYVSTGSACSSNHKNSVSHVLKAMGLTDKEIEGAIRFSFSEFNTEEDMLTAAEAVRDAAAAFRKLGSFR